MRSVVKLLVLAAVAWAFVGVSSDAGAEAVLRVIIVEVEDGKQGQYLEKLKKLQAISARLGVPQARVWHSFLSGPNTRRLAIAIESKDLATFAANRAKGQGDADLQKLLDALNKSGIRRVVSDSLLLDVTP